MGGNSGIIPIFGRTLNQTYMNLFRKRLLPGVMALFLAVPALAQEDGLPIYLNTAYSFEERATDLVSRLTLEEKQSKR